MAKIGNLEIENNVLILMIALILFIVALTIGAIYCGGATCLYK